MSIAIAPPMTSINLQSAVADSAPATAHCGPSRCRLRGSVARTQIEEKRPAGRGSIERPHAVELEDEAGRVESNAGADASKHLRRRAGCLGGPEAAGIGKDQALDRQRSRLRAPGERAGNGSSRTAESSDSARGRSTSS